MSGFAGVVQLDGAPADVELAGKMAAFLSFRGPDGQRVWHRGPVAFAHAALHTTPEASHWPQPLTLGTLTVTGDVRLDGIADLRARLIAAGEAVPEGAADALLLLHAYQAWGRDCLQHLAGDFSFAIWDAQERWLFCARDQLGIKPFFYARAGESVVFSNTLDCVWLHPRLSSDLNEEVIGEFLVTGYPGENTADTAFRDIHRLPAGHKLEVSAESTRVGRYWLPPQEPVHERRSAADYCEEMKQLLWNSVADRLRAPEVAIELSGGMDSSSIAAITRSLLPGSNAVRAFNQGMLRLHADVEPEWARRVAEALNIPIEFQALDDYRLFDWYANPQIPAPEPDGNAFKRADWDRLRMAARHTRVILTGHGGDVIYFSARVGHGLSLRQFGYALDYTLRQRRLPRIGLRRLLRRDENSANAPPWLLAQRRPEAVPSVTHPERPEVFGMVVHSTFPHVFEAFDAGFTGVPVEVRHPHVSRAIVEFALRTPLNKMNLVEKGMLRKIMRSLLPEEVLRRPKTALGWDPVKVMVEAGQWSRGCDDAGSDRLWHYVRRGTPCDFRASRDGALGHWDALRIIALKNWLGRGHGVPADSKVTFAGVTSVSG